MSQDDKSDGPVLPERDPKQRTRGVTVYLESWLWDGLDEMTEATNAGIKEKKEHFSRNELIEFYLKSAYERWRQQNGGKKTAK